MDIMDPTIRANLYPGAEVDVVLKKDQPTNHLTHGFVSRVLTHSPTHPRGIKVMLQDGQVGRAQIIYVTQKEKPSQ